MKKLLIRIMMICLMVGFIGCAGMEPATETRIEKVIQVQPSDEIEKERMKAEVEKERLKVEKKKAKAEAKKVKKTEKIK